ncbi:hypothetical protein AS034_16100 [[Bacillus] enclensis]|uniref:Uncharacterized protein YjbK n=1 Tax=[Bacillus] enclensis TaxID=1402860 RepID=A0A0V8HCQ4_9BACI|nr:CYTH domain-containing protein [[Bacillus] enclensis]KSU60363.1 hypothetical protein AS034_16100 [[Bacillus] enclensis]SCC23667.1 Uncharacterized protein YjbK [[Bacillus] enclensis]
MIEQEREIKLLLSEDSYVKVLNRFDKAKQINQINYYFDTPGYRLSKTGSTLRVREYNGKYTLTLKIRNSIDQNQKVLSDELSVSLTPSEASDLLNKKKDLATYFGGSNNEEIKEFLASTQVSETLNRAIYIGKLSNQRIQVTTDNNRLIDLDKTTFPDNHVEYELEIENLSEKDEIECVAIINELNIEYKVSTESKYSRFIKALETIPF